MKTTTKIWNTTLYELGNSYNGKKEKGVLIGAIDSGQIRCPKRGEWYLSGAIPKAYRAPNDLTESKFHIATLVKYKICTFKEIIGYV